MRSHEAANPFVLVTTSPSIARSHRLILPRSPGLLSFPSAFRLQPSSPAPFVGRSALDAGRSMFSFSLSPFLPLLPLRPPVEKRFAFIRVHSRVPFGCHSYFWQALWVDHNPNLNPTLQPYRSLRGPYRCLTGPEHAFRPMFMRVLTTLTAPTPQRGVPPSPPRPRPRSPSHGTPSTCTNLHLLASSCATCS